MQDLTRKQVRLRAGPEHEVLTGGAGPPLVWLHGVQRTEDDDPVLAALAGRFTVVAPQMPGRADLAELDDLRDIHDLALHYDSLLQALGLESVTLVGHSFGGMLAAEIAAHTPTRVGRLVLASPMGLWNDDYPVEDLLARPYRQIEELLWRGSSAPPPEREPADADGLYEIVTAVGAVAKYTWPIPDKGLRRRLHRISMPTLILFGEADAFVSCRYGAEFEAAIESAKARIMPGGHMAPYEQPEAFARVVEAFVSGEASGRE
jgi:pimeloyl-ACP methyl ester carboxylesterase